MPVGRQGNAFYSVPVARPVELSAFTVVDQDPAARDPDPDRVRRVVDLADAAESSGLAALWVAEHHFDGGGACPAPAVLLAACGARTRRLRLGSMVSVLPFHRPIDVAEEYALLDRLLEGRLNFGVGSGYLAGEFAGFGIDPADKRDRFDRALSTILAAFAGEPVLADPSASAPVRLSVMPVQRPYPPVWVAVQRADAVPHVARRGFGVALIPYATVDRVDELGPLVASYRAGLPPGRPGHVVAAVHVYAGPEPDLARRAMDRYLEARLRTRSTFYEAKSRRAPEHASRDGLERAGLAVFGDPTSVVARLQRFAAVGVDEVAGIFDFGDLAPEIVHGSVRALASAWPGGPARGE